MIVQPTGSRIIDSIIDSSKKNSELLGYEDHCDWHDTCDQQDPD